MSKRFYSPFNTLVLLAFTLGIVHFASSIGFSADTYTVPQTAAATLAWDPNEPAPDGYCIYQRTEGQSYDYSQPCWTGSGTSGKVYNLDWDTRYYFVVRAYAGALQSADSEEVAYMSSSVNGSLYRQLYSVSSDRSNPETLDGAVVDGPIYAFLEPIIDIKKVEFYIDGVLYQTENIAPYDLSGGSANFANPFDTTKLSQGLHTIRAQITKTDGSSETVTGEVEIFDSIAIETKYFISSSAGENGVITPDGKVTIDRGANQTFTIAGDSGFHIADVLVDGVSIGVVSSYTFNQVAADHTISASYAIDSHTIFASAGANGAITPTGSDNVNHGTRKTYMITPNTGYRVADVLVDGVSMGAINAYTFDNVIADHTITPTFTLETYTIAAAVGDNGTISPAGNANVNHNANKTYTIIPNTGYQVADVKVDGVSIGSVPSYIFSQVTSNHTIHATFTADTFAINATASANGAIIPEGVVDVPYGGSQTYTFAVNSGFCIADVQIDGQSLGAVGSYTFSDVKSPHTISVGFSESMVVNIQIEAEDGDLVWPMEIGDEEKASAGGFIWVPAGTGNLYSPSETAGYAEYHFDVPETGDYVVWGRQISNDNGSDSFFVSVDGQADMTWKTKLGGQDVWTWDVVSNRIDDEPRDATNPHKYRLEAGFHTLKIKQREDAVMLDTIVVTNDLSIDVSELDRPFQAPIIETDPYNQCISEFDTAALSLDVTDPGNGNLTYAWELPDGGSIIGSGNSVEFVPEAIGPHACPYRVNVVVTSAATLLSTSATFDIYVRLAGDINTDGIVNVGDKKEVRNAFGQTGTAGWIPADVNHDGIVNVLDKLIVRSQFGQSGYACQ